MIIVVSACRKSGTKILIGVVSNAPDVYAIETTVSLNTRTNVRSIRGKATIQSSPGDVETTAMRTSLQRPFKLLRISQVTPSSVGAATQDVKEPQDFNAQRVSISCVDDTGPR